MTDLDVGAEPGDHFEDAWKSFIVGMEAMDRRDAERQAAEDAAAAGGEPSAAT